MHLTIRLDPDRLRQWHLRLAQHLAHHVARITVEWRRGSASVPPAAAMLTAIEALVHRRCTDPFAPAVCRAFASFVSVADEAGDVVLDLTNGAVRPGQPTWQLRFDGERGETAAVGALVRGRTPVVSVVDAASGAEIVSGHPGTENNGQLVSAFNDVMARAATLVKAALAGKTLRHRGERAAAAPANTAAVAWFAIKTLGYGLLGCVYRLLYRTPHWQVGFRFVRGSDVIDLRAHPPEGWHALPDNRLRFYSDPFPVDNDGRTYLFVEDLEHRLNRGVISVVEFDAHGPIGTPRPVLDTGSHLSYPFVFAHRGVMWMVPESCSAGTIDLYRAERFPDGWVKQATLVSNIVASDATLVEHDGRWWMFATVQDDGGSYSDALHLWSAPDLLGPWMPHRRNPVLVDIATARPAGRIVRRGDKLIRPFQDCRKGYGTALGLAEITRLDDDGFEQRVETILLPGPLWPGWRLHTLNRAGQLECIDGSAWSRKFVLPSLGRRPRPSIEPAPANREVSQAGHERLRFINK